MLQSQTNEGAAFDELHLWISHNPAGENLTVETLAQCLLAVSLLLRGGLIASERVSPVGASLLAMDVNDGTGCLDDRVVWRFFASRLTPTVGLPISRGV